MKRGRQGRGFRREALYRTEREMSTTTDRKMRSSRLLETVFRSGKSEKKKKKKKNVL